MKTSYTFIEDIDNVLHRLGDSDAMLDHLLAKFRDKYHDTPVRLIELLEHDKQEEAFSLVHSIKGVSGNLGMETLYQDSLLLESCLRNKDSDLLSTKRDVFISELKKILVELDTVFCDAPQV